jgi:hypothetical protein
VVEVEGVLIIRFAVVLAVALSTGMPPASTGVLGAPEPTMAFFLAAAGGLGLEVYFFPNDGSCRAQVCLCAPVTSTRMNDR